ncbi:hypothetical protein BGX24_000931 [Mortierella sp. AD032]|nr:hypothetical protein BGX24_000931 [Mortierella sp. AD032]
MLKGDEPEEHIQAIRSFDKNLPHTSVPPATPDGIFFIDCHKDPTTQKLFVLWDDILQTFEDAVQVRHKARIVNFLKGPDFRVLEPRRIVAMPNIVLDVVVCGNLIDKETASLEVEPKEEEVFPSPPPLEEEWNEEGDVPVRNIVVSQESTSTSRRNPVYGLEEEAMDNYSHIDPVEADIVWSSSIQKASVPAPLQENGKANKTKKDTAVSRNTM